MQWLIFNTGGRQGKLPCLAFEVYDFFDEKWRKLPDVPSKRVFAMYAATEKHIVSVGGLMQPGNRGFSDACEVFDLETGTHYYKTPIQFYANFDGIKNDNFQMQKM